MVHISDPIRKEYPKELRVLIVQQTLADWVCQLASVGTKLVRQAVSYAVWSEELEETARDFFCVFYPYVVDGEV